MHRLINLSDDPWSLSMYDHQAANIEALLYRQGLDGLELMRWYQPQAAEVPMHRVVGRHMPFWPNWLDYWRGDKQALLAEFGSEASIQQYYDAPDLEAFIINRRNELIDAKGMGIKYAVFHISHVLLSHSCATCFPYNDAEIVDAFIDMTNEMLKGVEPNYTLLFENHWFPGLTFLDGRLAARLLDGINWPDKGFVLDTSHLMNTRPDLKDEGEAVDYILKVLEAMGDVKEHIKTIHLNSSRPWARLPTAAACDPDADYETRLIAAMKHVGGLDPHKPFCSSDIRRVLDEVKPEYLVYELSASSLAELEAALTLARRATG